MKRRGRSLMTSVSLAGACALLLFLAGCGGGGGGGASATSPTPPPAGYVPQNVSAAARAGSITVSWTPVTGATAYNVYWSTSPNVTKQNGTRAGSVTSPYVQTGLAGGTTRYYVATCVVGGSEGPDSSVVSATVPVSLVAGPDVGQYFDRGGYATGLPNYPDNSSHPLRGLSSQDNTLQFGVVNCLDCHYVSGPARTADECLKCHFENQPNAPAGNHRDGALQLAVVDGNNLPTAQFLIASIQDYDAWCLQCHASTTATPTSLGGVFPSAARKTVIDPAAFAASRHRLPNQVGCIHCHHPHGRSNTMLVRENPDIRRSSAAGPLPALFGVYPNDALNGASFGPPQNVPYRSRPFWADNTQPYLPEADDDQAYCNKACHVAKYSTQFSKDRVVKRESATGNYILTPANKKIYVINGVEYTVDNISALSFLHIHSNGEIVTTDNMVQYYAGLTGQTGPSTYRYPGAADANPANFDAAASPLPFRPDYPDGVRDFLNGYLNLGPIRYRFTCSTCHDPHGTGLSNTPGSPGYPDLRLPKSNPDTLCHECHR